MSTALSRDARAPECAPRVTRDLGIRGRRGCRAVWHADSLELSRGQFGRAGMPSGGDVTRKAMCLALVQVGACDSLVSMLSTQVL